MLLSERCAVAPLTASSAAWLPATAVQPPTCAVTNVFPWLAPSFWSSASSFALSPGCTSPTSSGFPFDAAGSTTRSSSGPSAGFTSSAQLSFVFCAKLCSSFVISASCDGNFCSRLFTACHCEDEASVSTATNATASAGATDAPAPMVAEPEPAPEDPPQPASNPAAQTTAATPKISRARILTPLSAADP